MKATAEQIQNVIVAVLDVSGPQTTGELVGKLSWLADAHGIAMNADTLAKDGLLEVQGDTSADKRYRINTGSFTKRRSLKCADAISIESRPS